MVAFLGFAAVLLFRPVGSFPVDLLVLLALGAGLFPLHVRAARCPRCRGDLSVPPCANGFAPEWDDVGGPLPGRCRTCGVGLGPLAPHPPAE